MHIISLEAGSCLDAVPPVPMPDEKTQRGSGSETSEQRVGGDSHLFLSELIGFR